MDIFRRLTNPTLKKLYRFVLKRLVGRFLEDDIALEQLDVQLGAGRVELTDLNINVTALAELLPPGLTFRLARAHVGRLRVEISYSKLLTESLAVFLDDVLIEIEPAFSTPDEASHPGTASDAVARELAGVNLKDQPPGKDGAEAAVPFKGHAESPLGGKEQAGEVGERLDFLAQWIEQVTSKVKVVVNGAIVRIASGAPGLGSPGLGQLGGSDGSDGSKSYLEFRCSSLKWCDETPEVSTFVADQSGPSAGIDRAEGLGKGGTAFAHKRLTLGLMVAELNAQPGRKLGLMRVGGTGCVVIKQGRDLQARGVPADAVLDVDVSLRHADVSLGVDECVGLLALSSAYVARAEQLVEVVPVEESAPAVVAKPVKPLFREDFWYFDGDNNNSSTELNFDTLSGLLEQYADARARLARSGGYGQSAFGASSFLSLGQSDVFYDCEDVSDDGVEGGGARSDRRGSMKFRVRMTGLDVTLSLAPESTGAPERGGSASENFVRLQMRHMSQTLHSAGGWVQSVAEIGTFVADWNDERGSCVRVVEVLGAASASPSVQVSFSTGDGAEARGNNHREDGEDIGLDVATLPLAVILDPRLVGSVSDLVARVQPHVPPTRSVDEIDLKGGGHGHGRSVSSIGNPRDRRVVMTVNVPKITTRIPADSGACSSDAHAALISSVRDGTSPVGWTPRETLAGEVAAPMLVLEVEGVAVRLAFGSPTTQETALECTRVACQMLLSFADSTEHDGDIAMMGLYFLEASRSSADVPLKVDFGLAKDIRKPGELDLARPGDADLNFLHTWEPNDGVDSDLDDVPPAGGFGGGLQSDDCALAEGKESSPRILLCVLPRLAVELSRLELVVLADILASFAAPSKGAPSASPPPDHAEPSSAPVAPVEVVVEARGATVVLHEAAAFAEDPGPHSFVLNLGNACIHVGGGSDSSLEGNSAPLVTVSAGDVCVHETLRCSRDDRLGTSGGGPAVNGPLLFLPKRDMSAHLAVEDLPTFGFVPVLYQTKWAKGTSPIAAELALGVSGPEAVFKTITATLNLYDVSLRHTVTSSWLPRLLGLVVGDVPAGRVASPNLCSEEGFGGCTNEDGEAGGGNLTKMFITVFNGAVDYMPQSKGPGFMHKPPRTPGVAAGAQASTMPPTKGRAVFPIGVLRVSSNMVAGAPMQGFKVVIRDIGLHMSNRVMDYCKEDAGLCCGALDTRRGTPLSLANNDFSSVQEYLESSHFVQIATLNFLDAFLRTRSQVLVASDAFTAVELWMGIVHVYTCKDSLSTCQALLGEWWALVNEVRTAEAAAAAAEIGKNVRSTPKRQTGRAVQEGTQESAVTSLLDDVEQDAFLPGSNKESPRVAERKADPGGAVAMGSTGEPGQPRKQSLVIEDYYCVSVEPPATQAAPAPFLAESVEESPGKGAKFADPPHGQGSSFLSEGEGPAQWLAAPKADYDDGEILSMESADDTSDSDGEEDFEAKAIGSIPSHPPVARRSNFGFSLPAPIEIELEDRNDAEAPEAKESQAWEDSGIEGIASSSPERGEWMSEDTDFLRHGGDGLRQEGSVSPQQDVANDLDFGEFGVPVEAPQMPASLSRGDSMPFAERAGLPTQAAGVLAGEAQILHHGELAVESNAPAKAGPVHGEQEARWIGRDPEASGESGGLTGAGMSSSSDQPEDFRVYPHYVPIPTTAEATSLPFLSGDPLVALGKATDGGADKGGSERVEQKLQFQLAIHDLSICWRLFKGRDWVERNAGEDDRGPHHASEKERRQSKVSTRGPPSRGVAGGKGRRHERSHSDTDGASVVDGGTKPRKAELLDALLENYQDEREGRGQAQPGRRASRQPKVKLLNLPRESGSARSGRRTGRDTSCMLEVVLQHSSIRLDSFHPGPPPSLLSNLLLSIKNLHASDTLTSNRPRKTLDHWRDDRRHPREFQQKMVTVRMTTRSPSDHFCPEDAPLGDEVMLKVRLLPIHLSFGQHTVDFLRSFSPPAKPSPTTHDEKVAGSGPTGAVDEGAGPLFISCCDVGSFKVKIDYQPRTIKVGALQNGDYMELLNLFPLEGVHLTLQKLLLTGASGWNGVTQLLLQSWVQDLTSNQLHKFLAGTTAVRPLVTMGKGVADLVLLPVEQYRRDGRVLRGLRKGTQSFLRAITIETLHTSHRVASFVSRTLDDIVTQPGAQASRRGLEYYDEQPTGVIDSLEHAYDALAKEVQVAAQTIIAIPYEDQEEVVGPHGRSYVRSVARALPVAVLRPVVGASEALSCTLLGFRNYMAPVMRKEEEMRWS